VASTLKENHFLNFSLIKSHFCNESINLNFVLVLRYFDNIAEAQAAHYWKKTMRRQ